MAHVSSGSGHVVLVPNAPSGGIRAVLSNFDVDSDQPKAEHTVFLDKSVLPLVNGRSSRVWLRGEASHTGSAAHNLELSNRRAARVADYLVSQGYSRSCTVSEGVGDSLAGPKRAENAEARAVSILAAALAPLPAPSPAPPTANPATQPRNTRFKIRLLGSISGGLGPAQIDNVYFHIWDVKNAVSGIYHYEGGGFGKGFKLSVSCTLEGPWNDMTTTGPISVDEFSGAARWTSGGAAAWTWNYLNVMALPRSIATAPRSMSIQTGFTVGAGVGSSVGELILLSAGPYHGL